MLRTTITGSRRFREWWFQKRTGCNPTSSTAYASRAQTRCISVPATLCCSSWWGGLQGYGGLQLGFQIKPALRHLPFDMQKSSIVLFLDEVLNKVLREGGEQQEVSEFLVSSLQLLDLQQPANPDFHPRSLLRLTRLLGFSCRRA